MHPATFAAALAMSLAIAGPANAALLLTTGGSPANTATDYSTPGAVSFDLDLENVSATRLRFAIEAEDVLGPLSLNAIVRNLSGTALNQFRVTLRGISFLSAGSVTPAFGTLGGFGHGADHARITFSSPEWAEFHFGNPLALDDKTDWFLDTRGLAVGDTFAISADIPEPSTVALLLPALCMAGVMGARRRKQR